MPKYRRFSDASVSEKILDTMFLVTMGIGYLFAMAHIYFSHQGRDHVDGLSVEDIRIAYYGEHQQTRLGAAINGAMGANLGRPEYKETIINWIENGGSPVTYDEKIAPILNSRCIMCHSKNSGMGLPPLDSYESVIKLIDTDTGASIQSLVRVSHIHLFGIAFILFFVGRIFILCDIPVMLKRITVAIPFIAMLVDILSWYITKVNPAFAYVVFGSGVLMGFSFGFQVALSIFQMWVPNRKVVQVEM
ncbi:MAG: hypothetical protein ACE5EH_11455 [Gammaproteobacteria bacterium]